ncbi:recombinase family protein [Actinomyces sp. oral taxon 448]|jgi:hypothetical protein|uniref:recombinase family protein n=1 Tax=Actinomyces sp. oral taxon 448 TaxID=712124 RepID=UPI0002188C94|nr:recombinase family protein [Actinomyces sp. oral taxon 448]EGQ73257.1 hypothetical protein HMPREF9062_1808 [Actinomyces sp. oral taxon 448 str. F0400]
MPRTTPTKPAIEDGVIIYTHGQHPAEITQQNAALRRYCQAAGLEVVTEFHDLGQRTNGLDMALRAAEDSCVRYLLTTTWPPTALDAEDALSVSEILDHYHTRLVTVDSQPPQEQPDGSTDDGRRQS